MIKSKILIIDDDNIIKKKLEKELMNEGYEVVLSDNGADGIRKIQAASPDLILLDVLMPGMDGYEVCRVIREDARISEVPIVMITSLNDLDSRIKGLESGADDFILKPFNKIELLAKVRTITRLNRYHRLLNERTRLEWVVERSDDGYLILDEYHHIVYANTQARIYLGLSKEYIREACPDFLQTVKIRYHCEPYQNWKNWLYQEPHDSLERYLVLPETETSNALWLQVTSLGQPSGPGTQHLLRLRDVSHLMSAQQDMIGFQRILNHKLRTPLSSLKISSELLANDMSDLSQEETKSLARTALQSIKRLHNDLSDISRFLEAPQQITYGSATSVEQIETIVRTIEKSLKLKAPHISIDDSIKKQQLSLTNKELEYLLWELLENAKKFHPEHNPIIEIYTKLENGKIWIQIMDNGSALTPDQINKVWQPYYQGEKYFTGEISGMGLGLTLVSTMVWQKGGTCSIYNRDPAPGIVVEIALPPHHQ